MFSHWENTKLKHATLNTALFLQKALTLDHKDRERPMESLGHRDASSLLFFFFFVWQVRTIRLAAKLRVAPAFEAAQDRPSQYFIERCKHIVSCWGRSCASLNTLSKWAGFQVGVEEEHKKIRPFENDRVTILCSRRPTFTRGVSKCRKILCARVICWIHLLFGLHCVERVCPAPSGVPRDPLCSATFRTSLVAPATSTKDRANSKSGGQSMYRLWTSAYSDVHLYKNVLSALGALLNLWLSVHGWMVRSMRE